jgi:hypothetical protein
MLPVQSVIAGSAVLATGAVVFLVRARQAPATGNDVSKPTIDHHQ